MSDVIYNISSGFYDSVNGDRLYSAADMNKPYKRVIADGIFPTPQGTPSTDFQVVAVSGMSVAVLAGNAMIGARWAENTDDVGITIAGNSSSSPRIDSIFLHIDTGMDTRAAGVVYRQGTAAGTPTAPAMVQTDNITELRLADILVAPSAAIITQANITDQRGGSDCPWVAGLIQQVDTSALFDQYRAAYAEQQQDQANEWNTFMDHLARDYDISMSLRKHESTYTSTSAASLIPINIDGYDTTKDLLQVYINGIFAVEGTHYIVKSATQIQLTNAISAGQKVHFVIYKAVMGGAQPIIPTDEQVQDAVDAYMDAHPGALVVDPELSDTSTHAIQNKAVTEAIENVNGRLDGIDEVLETGSQVVVVPVEAYGINASTGKNTSSSYWQYYRTAGFYKGTHVKATSTKGTLRSRIYFYESEDVNTFVWAASDYSQTDLDEDVVYPEGATCFRISGFVNGNPDNPLDLSAVTLEIEIPNATNIIDTLESDIEDIQNDLSETSEIVKKSVVSAVDTNIPYNLIPSDMEWTETAQINTNSGEVAYHATRLASDYIPIDASKQYLQIHIAVIRKEYNSETGNYIRTTIAPFVDYQYAFYDENKAFVASTSVSTDYVKVIPVTAKYVRVTLAEAARKPFARLIYASSVNSNIVTVGMMEYKRIPTEKYQMPLTGYESFKMICFGDSITHGDTTGNNDGLSYVNYASQYLNADIESVGFGSTTAAKVSNTGTGLFCFPNLCDCVVSDDPTAWDALDAWAASGNTSYAEHLTRLKAVDWSQVKAISILYGANDWAQDIPVGSDYNVTPGNYDGGIAYGITTLLTKYPHLQVMVLPPFYRSRTTGGETVISDDANGAGLTMMDYAASLKNVQKKLHVPVVDSGNWGINYLTMKVMSVDGTHPITDLGKQRIGHWFASAVKANLSPL